MWDMVTTGEVQCQIFSQTGDQKDTMLIIEPDHRTRAEGKMMLPRHMDGRGKSVTSIHGKFR